ncbi:hypothetical protein MKS88_002239 [Plasmodium brasilianum]|uniref:Uncharacterized protein n=1 Tax=Plasmodium brasilianum TaxID=5824 RepID=A0ACB9Y9H3_PLABR|nr:hypothetical protein MKS88_002239 [Plasmodium brasilianum]
MNNYTTKMFYSKNKVDISNLANSQEKLNESYMYVKKLSAQKFPKIMYNSEVNKFPLHNMGKSSILTERNNRGMENSCYKNTYLLNNMLIRKKSINEHNDFKDKPVLFDGKAGNVIKLYEMSPVIQCKNANCSNENKKPLNRSCINEENCTLSKTEVNTQKKKILKSKTNTFISCRNNLKVKDALNQKKNYLMTDISEYNSENTQNDEKLFGKRYFTHNDQFMYDLKNNNSSCKYENVSKRSVPNFFFFLNKKNTMNNMNKDTKLNNDDTNIFVQNSDDEAQDRNQVIMDDDKSNKNNFHQARQISLIMCNGNDVDDLCVEDNRCNNVLQNWRKDKNNISSIGKTNFLVKENSNSKIINVKPLKDSSDGLYMYKNKYVSERRYNEKLMEQKNIFNAYESRLGDNTNIFLKRRNDKLNTFNCLSGSIRDLSEKNIVHSYRGNSSPFSNYVKTVNSKRICSNITDKSSARYIYPLSTVVRAELHETTQIPISKSVRGIIRNLSINEKMKNVTRSCSDANIVHRCIEGGGNYMNRCRMEKEENNQNGMEKCKDESNIIMEHHARERKDITKVCEGENPLVKGRYEGESYLVGDENEGKSKNDSVRTKETGNHSELNRNKPDNMDTKNKSTRNISPKSVNTSGSVCISETCSSERSYEKYGIKIKKNHTDSIINKGGSITTQSDDFIKSNQFLKRKEKKLLYREEINFIEGLSRNRIKELKKVLKKLNNAKGYKFNIDKFLLQENGYEKIIKQKEQYAVVENNTHYSKNEQVKVDADMGVYDGDVSHHTNADISTHTGDELKGETEKGLCSKEDINSRNGKDYYINEVCKGNFQHGEVINLNGSKNEKTSLEFLYKIKRSLNVLDLSFNELIKLDKVKNIFWYLYIKHVLKCRGDNVTDFCEYLKNKIDEKMNKHYFIEYVNYKNFQTFSKSNFERFEYKMKILGILFYLLKSYPLDYDENKGCFYMLDPQKNKMLKSVKCNIMKNKLNHVKLIKEVNENFKNNFFFLDKIFIPKDAFFFVKDSQDIVLRDKSNKKMHIHQALVNDLKEDIKEKTVFDSLYASYPPFKSDYYRYIQKKRIQNKIRKLKEYILYYYDFNSVQDFFETLIIFDQEYHKIPKVSNTSDSSSHNITSSSLPKISRTNCIALFNLTKKVYGAYCKFCVEGHKDFLKDKQTNNDEIRKSVLNRDEQKGEILTIVEGLKQKEHNNKCITNIDRVRTNKNGENEKSSQFFQKRSNSTSISGSSSRDYQCLLKCKREEERKLREGKYSDENDNYEKDKANKINVPGNDELHNGINRNDKCKYNNSASDDTYDSSDKCEKSNVEEPYRNMSSNCFNKRCNKKENVIEETSSTYEEFFHMNDNEKKVKEVNFKTLKLFLENLGKIKGYPNFTSIDECFLGICFCDPDIPKHLFIQKRILPKNMNFNGFMNCMRYVPYVIPDFPLSTSYFMSTYNSTNSSSSISGEDIFNSRNAFLKVLKYRGKKNNMIELRNKIVLDIVKIFVLISWAFGVDTGQYNKLVDIPSDKVVDMVASSYYINYKYHLKKNREHIKCNDNILSSNSLSDYLSSSEEDTKSNEHKDISNGGKKEYNNGGKGQIKNEKMYKQSSTSYKGNTNVFSKSAQMIMPCDISRRHEERGNRTFSGNNHESNKINYSGMVNKNCLFEESLMRGKKKMSYKLVPKWHMSNDIFLSRLVSYDEIQISLHKIYPLFIIQTALIYMVHISCCLLSEEEWRYFFEKPFTLYNKLTPEDIALRYIKLKGYKFFKLSSIQKNKNIDIHHVFMNVPENMQCQEIYKLAINGESTSCGYLAEPFDIYHLMFISKVFWYIFLYSDNFLILRSSLFWNKGKYVT